MIFFLYLLLLSGFIFSRGFFTYNGVFILLLAIGLFSYLILNTEKQKIKLIPPRLLLLLLTVLTLVMYGGLYQTNYPLIFTSFFLLGVNVLMGIYFLSKQGAKAGKKILWVMVVIAVLTRVFMIWSSPSPKIDVYDYLKNGALGFMHGQNPYSMTYTKLYQDVTPDFYSYLPGMVYLTLPAVLFFGDPRYSLIVAELLTVFMIYKITKKNNDGLLYGVIFLNHPSALYMTEQSYTEPIVLFLLTVFIYFLIKKKNLAGSVSFGVLLATKQYLILIIPLVCRLLISASSTRRCLAKFVTSVFVAAIIIVPFYFWNKSDFLHDAVYLQYNFPPRYEGLSFFSFLYRFGVSYNIFVSALFILGALIITFKNQKNTMSGFFFLSSYIFLIFFFFNKWAFINYYFLISQLLLISAVFNGEKI